MRKKSQLIGKDPDAGKDWRHKRGQQRMRWLDGIPDSVDVSSANSRRWWRTGDPGMLQSMGSQRFTHNWAAEKVPPGNPYLPKYTLHKSKHVFIIWDRSCAPRCFHQLENVFLKNFMWTFIAAFYIIAKTWTQPRCCSIVNEVTNFGMSIQWMLFNNKKWAIKPKIHVGD